MNRKIFKIFIVVFLSILIVGCSTDKQEDTINDTNITFKDAIEKIKKAEAITVFTRNASEKTDDVITIPIKTIRGEKLSELIEILSLAREIENENPATSKYELQFFDENEDEIGKLALGKITDLEVEENNFVLTGYDIEAFNKIMESEGIDLNY